MSRIIYLDNAATSFPKPPEVVREAIKCMETYCVNSGRSSHIKSRIADRKIYEARENAAELFGVDNPEKIAFMLNTTMAINQGLRGVLNKGDHLIITSMEHNSIWRPASTLEMQGVALSIAQADGDGLVTWQDIQPHIRANTKMVAMLHGSNVTGGVNDIRSIGKELKKRKILFLVDAAQTAGCVPVNVVDDYIDILCFPGHKGLMGLPGTGGIYVREGVSITAIYEGGTGSNSESHLQPRMMPDYLESGTLNVLGVSALGKGIEFVRKHFNEIAESENYHATRLADNLANIKNVVVLGKKRSTGIVSVSLKGIAPSAAAHFLDMDYKIATRAGFHCSYLAAKTMGVEDEGSLRFSFGPFNTENDVKAATEAMFKIMVSESH